MDLYKETSFGLFMLAIQSSAKYEQENISAIQNIMILDPDWLLKYVNKYAVIIKANGFRYNIGLAKTLDTFDNKSNKHIYT